MKAAPTQTRSQPLGSSAVVVITSGASLLAVLARPHPKHSEFRGQELAEVITGEKSVLLCLPPSRLYPLVRSFK